MAFFQKIISTVANAFADLVGVVPIGEYNATPPTVTDGQAVNLQVDGGGQLKVIGGADSSILSEIEAVDDGVDQLHTDITTLNGHVDDVETKLDTGNSSLSSINGKVGTIRHTTTPNKSDASTGPAESDKVGSLYINGTIADCRQVQLTSGLATSAASLTEGPCNGIRVDTDALLVYAQLRERPLIASQSGADWTGAAGWSRVGNVWTHAASGGTGDLEITTSGSNGIIVGNTYCVIYTLTWTSGTSLTEKLGTGAGSARSSSATFVKLITSAGNAKIIFTPTNDAACSIDVSTVYVIPALPKINADTNEPFACSKIVGCALNSTPTTAHTTAKVHALYLRRAGAVEIS